MWRTAFHSDIHFISSPGHQFRFQLHLFYAKVIEPRLLKSSILSFHPPLPSTPSAAAKVRFLTSLQKKQSAPKSLIFIHTNTGLESLAAPQIQSQSGLLTDSFLLFIQTLTKFTSTPLIDSNHQHSTRGRISGGMAVDLPTEHC